jgi:hypothetical protein
MSAETPSLQVERWMPTVTETCLLEPRCAAGRQINDDSEAHTLLSQAVLPTIASPDTLASSPRLAPCTLRLIDPDPARLDRAAMLIEGVSADSSHVALPTRAPPDTTTRPLRSSLLPTRHTSDVSDSQSEASEAVSPIRPAPDIPIIPIMPPITVTILDPVVGRFDSEARLSPTVSTV